MTSSSHGKAERRLWLCAAERTAKRRKSSSGKKNKSRTSRTTPVSSSWSSPAAVPGSRHPRPPPASSPAPSPPLLRHLPDAVTLAPGLLPPPRAGEPRRLPQPGPAAPLPTTAGPNSWRGPVAQNRGHTAWPPRSGPEAAGRRREGAC
ncbi:proline-rich receptor-like protein kinase PERK8 [Parus major]|uniref:proline-rich receptor-like protein kinase PERK8 n=1 Tax=Parus major TaxID=9157 RepID=UPI000771620F|nr:proline-rich receptor-like protein kinase PERK8 [Parus major]